jgi:hypothetical protein
MHIDTFVKRVERELMDHAAAAHVAALLAHERTDCEVIVQHGDHLITVLPAIGREDASNFARKFAARAEARVGLRLRFGCATFPDDGLTFDSLLQRAEAGMMETGDGSLVSHVARERLRHVLGTERNGDDAAENHAPPLMSENGDGAPAQSLFATEVGGRGNAFVRSLRPRLKK